MLLLLLLLQLLLLLTASDVCSAGYCEYLAIDTRLEPELIPIAQQCMLAPLPAGWQEARMRAAAPGAALLVLLPLLLLLVLLLLALLLALVPLLVLTLPVRLSCQILCDGSTPGSPGAGTPYYYNSRRNITCWEHPMDRFFKVLTSHTATLLSCYGPLTPDGPFLQGSGDG